MQLELGHLEERALCRALRFYQAHLEVQNSMFGMYGADEAAYATAQEYKAIVSIIDAMKE